MAELGDVKMAQDSGLAETVCPSRGERALFRRLGNTSSIREMSSLVGLASYGCVCLDLQPLSKKRQTDAYEARQLLLGASSQPLGAPHCCSQVLRHCPEGGYTPEGAAGKKRYHPTFVR